MRVAHVRGRVLALFSRVFAFVSGVVDGASRLGRVRLVVVLASLGVLVFAFAAAADERAPSTAEELSSVRPSLPAGVDPASLPLADGRGMDQLLETMRQADERVEERQRLLASPESRQKREVSKTEHLGVSDKAAELLVESKFAELLNGSNAGAELDELADGRPVRKFIDDHTVVLAGDGQRPPVLVESQWPLRAIAADGSKQAVDLSLVRTDGEFAPVNASADVSISDRLSGGVQIGEVAVVPTGEADGELSGDGDGRVIYPNAQVDTDVVVKPLATGVEVFWQLRSPRAAEELTLDLDLPDDATAQATKSGAAVIVKNRRRIATVAPPMAVDAQGQDVPVAMSVRGEQLVLSLAHRDADVAFPILVDPVFEYYGDPAYGDSWLGPRPGRSSGVEPLVHRQFTKLAAEQVHPAAPLLCHGFLRCSVGQLGGLRPQHA